MTGTRVHTQQRVAAILWLLAVWCGCSRSEATGQVFVSTTGSDGGAGTSGDPFLTISHALAVVNATDGGAGSVVTVLPGTHAVPSALRLNSASLSCSVASAGACVLDGTGSTRVLWAADRATLSAASPPHVAWFSFVTDSTALGAAVRVDDARVALQDCNFTGAPRNAVHVTAASASVAITRCTFIGNGERSPGTSGGALHITAGSVTVVASAFSFNRAHTLGAASFGGAVYAAGAGVQLSITDTTFTGNKAHRGGAVWAGDATSVSINQCSFASNHAEGGGGALVSAAAVAAFTVNGSSFVGNSVGPTATGGAWSVEGSTPSATWCLFSGAQATRAVVGDGSHVAPRGGGVHVGGGSPTITDSRFTYLHVLDTGGGVLVTAGSPVFTRVEFVGNVADINGGAVGALGGSPAFSACSVSLCLAGAKGGGVFAVDSSPSLVGSVVSSNTAGTAGGGLYLTDVGMAASVIHSCGFVSNAAPDGGGMAIDGGPVTIVGCTVATNAALNSGGGVRVGGGTTSVSLSTFIGNTATNGGALLVNGGTIAMTSSMLTQNGASTAGGALFDQSAGHSTYTGVVVRLNQANVGGGVFLAPSQGSSGWTRCDMYGNKSPTKGGAAFVFGGRHAFVDTSMWDNQAAEGGGLHVHAGVATVSGGATHDNVASYGGGLYVTGGNLTLSGGFNCSFNSATTGGCLHAIEGFVSWSHGCVVSFNRASGSGGGASVVAAFVQLVQASVVGNQAGVSGGAGACQPSGHLSVIDSTFTGNQAATNGGALAMNGPLLTVSRCSFVGNAATYGGALHSVTCPQHPLSAATFSGNQAARGGGAIHLAGGDLPCAPASVCSAAHPCSFSGNVATYGPDMSSRAHQLEVVGVPASVSAADSFSPVVTVVDVFGQRVTALDGVTEAMIVFASVSTRHEILAASLVGRSAEAVRSGVATMQQLRLTAPVGTMIQVEFASEPAAAGVVFNMSMEACPAGHLLSATGDDCSVCPDSSFSWNPFNKTCDTCPSGAECRGGSLVVPTSGYWHSSPRVPQFHKCITSEACAYAGRSERLLAARNGSDAAYTAGQCAPGYGGVLCGHCSDGYFMSVGNQCDDCDSDAGVMFRFIVASCVGVAFVGNTIASFLRFSRGGRLRHHNMSGQMIKVFVSFLQMSALTRSIDLNWSLWLLELMGFEGLLVAFVAGDGSVACLVDASLVNPVLFSFYMTVMTPALAFIVVWIGWTCAFGCQRCGQLEPRLPRDPAQDLGVAATADAESVRRESPLPAQTACAPSSFAQLHAATSLLTSPATVRHGGRVSPVLPPTPTGWAVATSAGTNTTTSVGDGNAGESPPPLRVTIPAHQPPATASSGQQALPVVGAVSPSPNSEDQVQFVAVDASHGVLAASASVTPPPGSTSSRDTPLQPSGWREARGQSGPAAAAQTATVSYSRYMQLRFLPSCVIAFFFVYPQVFHAAVRVLHCVDVDNGAASQPYYAAAAATRTYLAADTDVVCWTGDHVGAAATAGVVLFLCVLLPALALKRMYDQRDELMEVQMVRTFGFLYACYEPEHFWWEFVTLFRKVAIVVVVELGADMGSGMQQQVYLAIVVGALALHFAKNPFHDPLCDLLESSTLVVLAFTLYCGRFFQPDVSGRWEATTQEWWLGLVVACTVVAHIAVCVAVVMCVLHHTVSRRLKRHAGVTMSTRMPGDDMYRYFRRHCGVRLSRVLTAVMSWVDDKFDTRRRQIEVAHEDLVASRLVVCSVDTGPSGGSAAPPARTAPHC